MPGAHVPAPPRDDPPSESAARWEIERFAAETSRMLNDNSAAEQAKRIRYGHSPSNVETWAEEDPDEILESARRTQEDANRLAQQLASSLR
ncbi:MAG: hypothetical protein WC700_04210 [Gemmatimonadaceae bacterium]